MSAKSLFPVLIGVSLGKATARAKDSNLMENEGFRTFAMIIVGAAMVAAAVMIISLIWDGIRSRRKK